MTGLDDSLTKLFELAPSLIHPKRQAARRRRWFAHLSTKTKEMTTPVKYLATRCHFHGARLYLRLDAFLRWTIWRDCAEWWLSNWDNFRAFLENEKGARKQTAQVCMTCHFALHIPFSF
jgi:hypothetical protein